MFDDASLQQTLAGNIVLRIATTRTRDKDLFAGWGQEEQAALRDHLATPHRAKIDLADEILVIKVGRSIGPPTRSEIEYADGASKIVNYLERSTQSSEAAADGVVAWERRILKVLAKSLVPSVPSGNGRANHVRAVEDGLSP